MNIEKALKKLDEMSYNKKMQVLNYPNLREILLAGQDNEVEKKLKEHWKRMDAMVAVFDRAVIEVEQRLDRQDGRMDALFNKLARIEEASHSHGSDGNIYKPSKPTEPLVDLIELDDICYREMVEPVTAIGKSPDYEDARRACNESFKKPVKDEKPEERIMNCGCKESNDCDCVNKDDKPSEFISIPRGVAEKWIKDIDTYGGTVWEFKIYDAVKQALKGQE